MAACNNPDCLSCKLQRVLIEESEKENGADVMTAARVIGHAAGTLIVQSLGQDDYEAIVAVTGELMKGFEEGMETGARLLKEPDGATAPGRRPN